MMGAAVAKASVAASPFVFRALLTPVNLHNDDPSVQDGAMNGSCTPDGSRANVPLPTALRSISTRNSQPNVGIRTLLLPERFSRMATWANVIQLEVKSSVSLSRKRWRCLTHCSALCGATFMFSSYAERRG